MIQLRRHPMTILEVLVAMVILVIIMGFLAQMVYRVDQISRRQNQQSELFRDQRLLMSLIELDLRGMVTSPSEGGEICCRFNTSSSGIGQFITNSGLGISREDSSVLQEVGYALIDSDIIRYYSRQSSSSWDFTTAANRKSIGWASTWEDSTVILSNVDSFYMQAFDIDDVEVAKDSSTTYPAYVKTYVEIPDEAANSVRKFRRRIHFNRGEQ